VEEEAIELLQVCLRTTFGSLNTGDLETLFSLAGHRVTERKQPHKDNNPGQVLVPIDVDGFLFSHECTNKHTKDLGTRVTGPVLLGFLRDLKQGRLT
jgi:hypothetical protein